MGKNPIQKTSRALALRKLGLVSSPVSTSIVKEYDGRQYIGCSFWDIGEQFIFNSLFDEPCDFQGELIAFIGSGRLGLDVSIFKVDRW